MPKLQKNAQLWVLVVVVLLVAPHGTACLCSQHNPGVALRRTRRVDGVEVDRSLLLDAVLALRTATTPTAPVRGRLDTARDPRGGSRRTGARRWRTGVGWRPTTTQYRRRPLSGAVLEVSPVLPEAPRDDEEFDRYTAAPAELDARPPDAYGAADDSSDDSYAAA